MKVSDFQNGFIDKKEMGYRFCDSSQPQIKSGRQKGKEEIFSQREREREGGEGIDSFGKEQRKKAVPGRGTERLTRF